jgi:hypothetical protein
VIVRWHVQVNRFDPLPSDAICDFALQGRDFSRAANIP